MALLTVGGASGASTTIETAGTTIKTFSTPGTYRWTVPTGVTRVTFDVFGASGGNVVSGLSVVALGGTRRGGGGGWYGGAGDDRTGGGSGFISRLVVDGAFPGGTQGGNGKVVIQTP